MNTNTLQCMSYGIYVLATLQDKKPVGCIVSSMMQVSSSPSIIAVCLHHKNFTYDCLTLHKHFSFSILSEKSNPEIISTFGHLSSKNIDKFSSIDFQMKSNLPIISDCYGYGICDVISTIELGEQTIFLGKVSSCDTLNTSAPPMTYHYYRHRLKGNSSRYAPIYSPKISLESSTKKTGTWECQVCFYPYEGKYLPEDFRCPVCNQYADKFMRIG